MNARKKKKQEFATEAVANSESERSDAGKAGSVKQAAALMGLPAEVLKAAKNAGCPGFDDHHRVDCELVKEWLARPENRHFVDASPTIRRAVAEANIAETKDAQARFEFERERGLWVLRQEMSERLLKLSADQVTVLRQWLENQLPALAVGKSLDEVRNLCRAVVDQLHGEMQKLVDSWVLKAKADGQIAEVV